MKKNTGVHKRVIRLLSIQYLQIYQDHVVHIHLFILRHDNALKTTIMEQENQVQCFTLRPCMFGFL